MARINKLTISGYRSIKDEIEITFPENSPVVLVGENNSGKSNIVRALDLVLGELWPGSREPEDHDFWNRDCNNGCIEIKAEMSDFTIRDNYGNEINLESFYWKCEPASEDGKPLFRAITSSGHRYVSNEMRDRCICVVIGADRRLNYQLSYTSKNTLLSKLMRKFHNRLVSDDTRVEYLKEKFEELINIFQGVDEFSNFQISLKEEFSTLLKTMSYGLQVDFSAYDPSNYFRSLRVFPHENNITRTFEELGTGQEQILALAFAHAYAKAFFGGIILVIEEPEAHLHPLAQEWLAKKIRQMANDGLQILLTTHSPSFVDVLGIPGLVLVRKRNNTTFIKQLTAEDLTEFCLEHGALSSRTNQQTILPFYAGSATKEILAGLFSKMVVLVEGPTEALSLPIYFSRVELDVSKEGIAIIPVMGKGNLAKWWRFFQAYEIPTYLTFDNDNEDDQDENKRKDALNSIEIDEDEIESIIQVEDWNVNDKFCVFGKDFETTLRCSFQGYRQLERQAKDQIGDSKPLVARYVAEKLQIDDSVGWTKIGELKNFLINILNPQTDVRADEDDEPPF
ncbi:MAG TPA: AAA family ATPase [Thermodesulfobacteriota bacterium]|nr:AAA family ATPase [Thermodesulfobacteriota bacterium]